MSAGKKNTPKPSNVFDQITRFNLNLLKLFVVYAGVICDFVGWDGMRMLGEFLQLPPKGSTKNASTVDSFQFVMVCLSLYLSIPPGQRTNAP